MSSTASDARSVAPADRVRHRVADAAHHGRQSPRDPVDRLPRRPDGRVQSFSLSILRRSAASPRRRAVLGSESGARMLRNRTAAGTRVGRTRDRIRHRRAIAIRALGRMRAGSRREGAGRPQDDNRRSRLGGGGDLSCRALSRAQERCGRDPGCRSRDPPEVTDRNGKERSHDARIELRAGAREQLGSRGRYRHRLLVRSRRRHHLERIRDRNDPRAERDLLARESMGVTGAVVPLVMLGDRLPPLAQPRKQRRDDPLTGLRVATEEAPLPIVRPSGLVEDPAGHAKLADVVQKRRPSKPILIVLGEPDLAGDDVGECAHSLGVPARLAVVGAQRRYEREDLLSGRGRLVAHAAFSRFADPILEHARAARAPCHAEAPRGPVGEHERQLQQHGEGKPATRDALHGCSHRGRNDDHRRPPPDDPRRRRRGDRHRDRHHRRCRCEGGYEHRGGSDREAQQRSCPPAVRLHDRVMFTHETTSLAPARSRGIGPSGTATSPSTPYGLPRSEVTSPHRVRAAPLRDATCATRLDALTVTVGNRSWVRSRHAARQPLVTAPQSAAALWPSSRPRSISALRRRRSSRSSDSA